MKSIGLLVSRRCEIKAGSDQNIIGLRKNSGKKKIVTKNVKHFEIINGLEIIRY